MKTKTYTEGKAQKCAAFGEDFDSLLEMRYAHLFERIGWIWERPKNGFLVAGNSKLSWLPDFRLTMNDGVVFWVEVKPAPDFLDFPKLIRAIFQNKNVVALFGMIGANITVHRKGSKTFNDYLPANAEEVWDELLLTI